jgi:uncharacterized protein YraI
MKHLILALALVVMTVFASAASAQGDLPGATGCGYAPMPRLLPGEQARVTPGLPNVLRSQPYRGGASAIVGEIPAGAVFTVLAGYAAQCSNGMWWYYVSYNNVAGWTPEGSENGVYWTEPLNGEPLPPVPEPMPEGCPIAPRLNIGGSARVTPGLPNVIRNQPYRGWGSVIVGLIPAGGVFSVQSGPSCDGSINWWQVSYNGLTGWTGEGENGAYWVEPTSSETVGCTGTARLTVGASGFVPNGTGTSIYAQANPVQAIATLPGGSWFRVIAGPNCADGLAWYQLNWQGITGWVFEGQNGGYTIEPFVCGGFRPSRLLPGYNGRVLPGTPNNLRGGPSQNDRLLGVIPGGQSFTIVGGPQCNNNGAWWQVNYNGTTGWTMEGQGSSYWLEPLS